MSDKLNAPPLRTPMVDDNGLVTPMWQLWFQRIYEQAGGALKLSDISVTGNAATATTATTAGSAGTVTDPSTASFTYAPSGPITASDGGTSGKIDVVGVVLTWSDGHTATYLATSLMADDLGGILNYSTRYYLYCDDTDRSGGHNWKATSIYSTVNRTGRLYLDKTDIPAALAPPVVFGGGGGGAYRGILG